MSAHGVTHEPRRYGHVFVCVACDRLAHSARADSVTCGQACRVWTHRHPQRMRELRAMCASYRITPALVQECAAVKRLIPQEMARIAHGDVEIADVRPALWSAYVRLRQEVTA